MTRTYPYKGWALQPSFKPVEVEFVSAYASWGNHDYGDHTASRKLYARKDIHATKANAIAFGRQEILRMQSDLEKKQNKLQAKRMALDKAERA